MESTTTNSNFITSRLFVYDRVCGFKYLFDTGADISVIPRHLIKFNAILSDYRLFAANGTQIKTYGQQLLTLDLGLRRNFSFLFVIADVDKPTIGADFYHVLVFWLILIKEN